MYDISESPILFLAYVPGPIPRVLIWHLRRDEARGSPLSPYWAQGTEASL
jgi:hypothetical protein